MPFWILYGVADLVFVLLYYVFGYRKKVVRTNLINSFPKKSNAELKSIERKFYRYFCDLTLETFKTLTISNKNASKRCRLDEESQNLLNRFHADKQSIILVMGHFGNWELAGAASASQLQHKLYVIYHPLTNNYFDSLMIFMRTRLGNKLYAMNDTLKGMIRDKDEITATAFIADQTPHPKGAYWTTFLNQDTPVFFGTEKIARKLNYPVVFFNVKRIKRGYYKMFAEVLFDNPKETNEGEISEAHTNRLEEEIIKQPEIWLWSHRRWKHKRDV